MLSFYRFLAFIFFSIFFSCQLAAQNTGHQMKLVFPFGDPRTQSTCPLPYRTLDGCCDGAQETVYTLNNRRGCCRPPNEHLTVGANSACCPALPIGQNRWGQTYSSVCGGNCPPPSEIRSFQTFNSCCKECNPVSGVVAFQASDNVCGTCCSRVPESCGNAGIRLCSEGTGSAYCSKLPDKCKDPDDWVIGSHGEGGYTCCDKCPAGATRYASTNSSCGSCCTAPMLMMNYGAAESCCAPTIYPQTRWGRTESSVCGGYCPPTSSVKTYSGISSCCPTCNEVLAFQSSTNVCGTCCSRIPESCGNVGVRVCEPGTGSAYCSIDPAKPCSGDGYYVVGSSGEGGYSCMFKSNPCGISGSWNAVSKTWACPVCLRNGSFYTSGNCGCNNSNCNQTCSIKTALYSCQTSFSVVSSSIECRALNVHNGACCSNCFESYCNYQRGCGGVASVKSKYSQMISVSAYGSCFSYVAPGRCKAYGMYAWGHWGCNPACTKCAPWGNTGRAHEDDIADNNAIMTCADFIATTKKSACIRNGSIFKDTPCTAVGSKMNETCTASAIMYSCQTSISNY